MESTPPGGFDPPNTPGSGFDQVDQLMFYVITAIILLILGRYSDQVMQFGQEIYQRVSGNGYQTLNDKLTESEPNFGFDDELGQPRNQNSVVDKLKTIADKGQKIAQKGAKAIKKSAEHLTEEIASRSQNLRGASETDLDVFTQEGDSANLLRSVEKLDGEQEESATFQTFAAQLGHQQLCKPDGENAYAFEENKESPSKEKSKPSKKSSKQADAYHALPGDQKDFELQKMKTEKKKPSQKPESYHRLQSSPSKQNTPPEEDTKPVKLTNKDKGKSSDEKRTNDDIESFLLNENEL